MQRKVRSWLKSQAIDVTGHVMSTVGSSSHWRRENLTEIQEESEYIKQKIASDDESRFSSKSKNAQFSPLQADAFCQSDFPKCVQEDTADESTRLVLGHSLGSHTGHRCCLHMWTKLLSDSWKHWSNPNAESRLLLNNSKKITLLLEASLHHCFKAIGVGLHSCLSLQGRIPPRSVRP